MELVEGGAGPAEPDEGAARPGMGLSLAEPVRLPPGDGEGGAVGGEQVEPAPLAVQVVAERPADLPRAGAEAGVGGVRAGRRP
ncbi:hypothetical protein AB0K16_50400 [Nonomuraea jabiensis]|uniref:hypothetical protein n=1 Tax=Nonomuraea jabiensis TaxID=882448 RepID=UPI0034352882